ncbi:SMI1/KNR4 family protein [Salmonella enterica subsp. enterica]|uniref:SMI1/KNR4 family protein n=1 Tax=Salmonella enterica TaxID=28901 RepID=UPI000D5672C3|nr:SMI1/KNR4 family protein [Salmonella enterica]EAC2144619.1 SMI1/KNR4 family protein [Salmonella enterica subsp. enterica]EAW1859553.1 SMI1/KNR4 family protein [Salmonella enterica subsp. enterica]EAW1864050.1 SMI1/KNR4 family protein [Salmonella enterica subsp. enterica]PVL83819.1 SMI1/KNR4 family protein [Salmonella enterica subsp. enterica serovar Weslaco]
MEQRAFLIEINKLIASITSKNMTVKGCSTEDILYLEENYGELPKSYKLFLSLLGVESGDFKEGTDLLFKDINDINKYTIELMQENNISIPVGMYSFLLHQGYSALFFIERGDDPSVYCYTEGKEIKKTKYVFSEYVLAEIELYNRYQ